MRVELKDEMGAVVWAIDMRAGCRGGVTSTIYGVDGTLERIVAALGCASVEAERELSRSCCADLATKGTCDANSLVSDWYHMLAMRHAISFAIRVALDGQAGCSE